MVVGGAFAVYIIQVIDPVCGKLFAINQYALESLRYTQCLPLMLFFCVFFFCVCLIYNKIIQKLLFPIMKPIGNRIEYLILKLIFNDK